MKDKIEKFQKLHVDEYGFEYSGDLNINVNVGNIGGYWKNYTTNISSINDIKDIEKTIKKSINFIENENPNNEFEVSHIYIETTALQLKIFPDETYD